MGNISKYIKFAYQISLPKEKAVLTVRSKFRLFFDAKRTDTNGDEFQSSLGEAVDISGSEWFPFNPTYGPS